MPLLVGDVIDEARDRHPSFDRNKNPQKVVRRFLSGYTEELAGKINRIDSTALLVEVTQAMPLSVFDDGITLPANRGVAAVVAVDDATTPRRLPIDLIPYASRGDRNVPVNSAWTIGGKLYLNGTSQSWQRVTSVAVAYTPAPASYTADTDTIALPIGARRALTEAAAVFMARRSGIPINDFVGAMQDAEQQMLLDIANALGHMHFRTRDVWP